MTPYAYLAAAVFLPLFPLSMVFNRLFARLDNPWWRVTLLLVWPQLGLLALSALDERPPAWIVYWAVLTAGLYAFRTLTLRDLALWTAHMATSAWSLLWLLAMVTREDTILALQAVGLSIPFMLLAWMVSRLESVYGAAYAGAYGGLAQAMPRLSSLLVITILAAVGTPLSPAFSTLLALVTQSLSVVPGAAVIVLAVWFLWAWAGARMTGGMVVGPVSGAPRPDLTAIAVVPAASILLLLALAGAASLKYLL